MSRTECNSGTEQELPIWGFYGRSKKYNNYIRHLAGYVLIEMCAGIVERTVAILLSSIVVLTPNGNFWVDPLLHSVSGMISLYFRALWSARHRTYVRGLEL